MRQQARVKLIERRLLLQLLSCLLILAQASCARLPRHINGVAGQSTSSTVARSEPPSQPLININTASRADLEKLPGIGEMLAARIVEHREKYGRFRRTEHLLMVRGISEQRLSAISKFLSVE